MSASIKEKLHILKCPHKQYLVFFKLQQIKTSKIDHNQKIYVYSPPHHHITYFCLKPLSVDGAPGWLSR